METPKDFAESTQETQAVQFGDAVAEAANTLSIAFRKKFRGRVGSAGPKRASLRIGPVLAGVRKPHALSRSPSSCSTDGTIERSIVASRWSPRAAGRKETPK